MARPDFKAQAAARLASERTEYTPALIDLLRPDDPSDVTDMRRMRVDRIYSNPGQPRQFFDEEALQDLAASIREHGVLHMADSELSKSAVNNSRPQYVLTEIPHSSPRQWNVELDPGLVRWRTVQRERAQEREGGSA